MSSIGTIINDDATAGARLVEAEEALAYVKKRARSLKSTPEELDAAVERVELARAAYVAAQAAKQLVDLVRTCTHERTFVYVQPIASVLEKCMTCKASQPPGTFR